jgi:3-oxoacid CoA-transferase subunit B
MIVTDLAVFTLDKHGGGGLTLIETAPGISVEEIRAKTEPDFKLGGTLAA